jgi:hypothetical protein
VRAGGTKLSPQEAGRLSGLARRIKRDGRVDLAQVPTIPGFRIGCGSYAISPRRSIFERT